MMPGCFLRIIIIIIILTTNHVIHKKYLNWKQEQKSDVYVTQLSLGIEWNRWWDLRVRGNHSTNHVTQKYFFQENNIVFRIQYYYNAGMFAFMCGCVCVEISVNVFVSGYKYLLLFFFCLIYLFIWITYFYTWLRKNSEGPLTIYFFFSFAFLFIKYYVLTV